MFRPSDDATLYPLLIPSNFFAVVSLRQWAEMLEQIHHDVFGTAPCRALATEVEKALKKDAIVQLPQADSGYAFEVDRFGKTNCMDDANVPDVVSSNNSAESGTPSTTSG
jgi:meiotically up-regulated gene 157 (Mug157) protein